MAGIDVKHIPYSNTPGVVTGLLSGDVDYGVELAHAVRGQVESGQLKLLAVGSPARWPTIPTVPTVAESGVPGYAVVGWYGWLYPAGTPQTIVDKTNAALKEVLSRPDIREQLEKVGAVVHFRRQPNSANISPPKSINGNPCARRPALRSDSAFSPSHISKG